MILEEAKVLLEEVVKRIQQNDDITVTGWSDGCITLHDAEKEDRKINPAELVGVMATDDEPPKAPEPMGSTPLFSKDSLPGTGEAPGGAAWAEFRKTATTKAMRIAGAFQVVTSHGGDPVLCQDGWLAIDSEGFPYPITDDEFQASYAAVAS